MQTLYTWQSTSVRPAGGTSQAPCRTEKSPCRRSTASKTASTARTATSAGTIDTLAKEVVNG